MAPKRSATSDQMTGREKKKLKVSVARTIAVQPSAQAGPSKRNVASISTFDSLTGLPSTIDVEKFVEARSFEIDAMHNAMKTASSTSTHRVWQTLPRHLRRRAASHDVRRVPIKLRERATAEMDPARKTPSKKATSKHGKFKQVNRTNSFLKRQTDKTWLETHMWHAKRMHMENMWGYRLAVSPTEKSYRPSHRASLRDAIIHDASYYSHIGIKGPEHTLISMLESFCDTQGPGPGSKRFVGGSRILETHIYKRNMYPYDLLAPLTVIWRPQTPSALTTQNTKGKGNAINNQTASIFSTTRNVWLKFHPSVKSSVLDTLKEAASWTLAEHKKANQDSVEIALEIIDLQGHFNVFEIMGPKSSQVIHGALSPINSENRSEFLQFWASLINLQSVGSLPRGMVVGFKAVDPRLSFPPKNSKPQRNDTGNLRIPPITLPSSSLAESEIWIDNIRSGLANPRFKKKDLDNRRSKNDIPGTPLHAVRQDDRIPVLLFQRSMENSNTTGSQSVHGWTLMVPAGWGMPFFNSLVFTNSRVAGQFERQTQAYESGTTYFPRDYPSTESYETYASNRALEEKATWERKPPAKRVNYVKLDTHHPWKADWEGILGMQRDVGDNEPKTVGQHGSMISTGKDTNIHIRPWLLRGSEVPKILSNVSAVFNHSAALVSEINRLRTKRGHALLSGVKPNDLLQGALVNVKLTTLLRGAPQDLAMIYALSDNVCRKWEKLIMKRRGSLKVDQDMIPEDELASMIPEETAIVGYVTTGHYSLSRGHGFALGAISLNHFLSLEQQSMRLYPSKQAPSKLTPIFVGLRNIDGSQCRIANIEVLADI